MYMYKKETKEITLEDKNLIMAILCAENKDVIDRCLKKHGYDTITNFIVNEARDEDELPSVDDAEKKDDGTWRGPYDVTIGFNQFGEERVTKPFKTKLEAEKFSAVRMILGYDIGNMTRGGEA